MLDHELIFSLKSKYGNVYSIQVKSADLVFRELTFAEYSKIMHFEQADQYTYADIEDFILENAIVYPDNFDVNKIPPGTVSLLSEEILDISGFYSAKIAKAIMESKRLEANEVKNLMKAFVLATISSYTPEQLEEMTFSQLAERVALAEKIIEIQQGVNGLESTNISLQLIDPEEEQQKAVQRAKQHNDSKLPGAAEYDDPIARKLWGSS